jgi:hypothetical protein
MQLMLPEVPLQTNGQRAAMLQHLYIQHASHEERTKQCIILLLAAAVRRIHSQQSTIESTYIAGMRSAADGIASIAAAVKGVF